MLASDSGYALGRSGHETQRLEEQAQLYDPFTRWLFEQAGIKPGMKVLDMGSGAGDVALIAAHLVGPTGSVVGVDVNAGVLEIARERARQLGFSNVTFQAGDIRDAELGTDFDGLVGRLVLMYSTDPSAVLNKAIGHVKPGGIVAFEELDAGIPLLAQPSSPLLDKAVGWVWEAFERSNAQTRMGFKLFEVFQAAGLPVPVMQMFTPVGGGEHWGGYEYLTSTLRSLLPRLVEYGIASEVEVDIDTFTQRLRGESGTNGIAMLPAHVGAWTLKR